MAGVYAEYKAWVDELLHRLGKTEADLTQGRMDQDWLLVPLPEHELSGDQVAGLFRAVRNWLLLGLQQEQPHASLRRRLAELQGLDSLPLLFAMRQVAYEFGASYRYWPHFHEHLLGKRVDLQTVYLLAPSLADLWIRFYRLTGRTLRYPTAGPVNMKWPTTHAGLLASHIRLIEAFGRELKAEVTEGVHPILKAEVDEFQVELLAWLRSAGEGESDLARRLDHVDLGLPTAALALRELVQRWTSLEASLAASEEQRPKALRPRLQYDAEQERVQLVLPEAEWSGHVSSVVVAFGNLNRTWVASYDPRRNVSTARNLVFPIATPDWPLHLDFDNGARVCPVLRSPFEKGKGGLLFDAAGWRVRTWKPDESFYLIVAESSLRQPWLHTLFEEIHALGQPSGQWDGYCVLWVKSRALVNTLDHDTQATELERLGAMIDEAGTALSLPSLNDLFKPRLRAVMGLPARKLEGKEPTYLLESPPAFEVVGLWSRPMACSLDRWDAGEQRFTTVATCTITSLPHQGPVVVEPFTGPEVQPGRYQMCLMDEREPFVLVRSGEYQKHMYRLDLHFMNGEDIEEGRILSGANLRDGRVAVGAWPGATVSLHAVSASSSHSIPLTVNEDGKLYLSVHELLPNLGPGDIRLFVSHGAVRSEELLFLDAPSVRDLEWKYIASRLMVQGTVVGPEPVKQAQVLAFGSEPWQGNEIWSQIVPVAPGGRFAAALPILNTRARWVVISAPGAVHLRGKQGLIWGAVRLDSEVVARQSHWRLGNLESWEKWGPVADWLANQRVTVQDLREAVTLSRMVRFAREAAREAARLRPSVRKVSDSLRQDLLPLLQGTKPPRITLVPAGTDLPFDLPPTSSSQYLPGAGLEPHQASMLLTGTIPHDGLRIVLRDTSGRAEALVVQRNGQTMLVASEALVYCGSCKRFAPNNAVFSHKSCKSFTPLQLKKELPVIPAIVWEPIALTQGLLGLVERLINEGSVEGLSEAFGEWLNDVADFYVSDPRFPSQTAWFERVCNLTAALAALATHPMVGYGDRRLLGLAPDFATNQRAAKYLLDKILAWAE